MGRCVLKVVMWRIRVGIAGTLLFAAVSDTVDVRYVPDFLDRFWLLGQAAIAGVFATAVIRK